MLNSILQRQIILPHQVRNHRTTAPTNSRMAVDQHYPATLNRLVHEFVAAGPVLFQISRWDVVLVDQFVAVLVGEFGFQLGTD